VSTDYSKTYIKTRYNGGMQAISDLVYNRLDFLVEGKDSLIALNDRASGNGKEAYEIFEKVYSKRLGNDAKESSRKLLRPFKCVLCAGVDFFAVPISSNNEKKYIEGFKKFFPDEGNNKGLLNVAALTELHNIITYIYNLAYDKKGVNAEGKLTESLFKLANKLEHRFIDFVLNDERLGIEDKELRENLALEFKKGFNQINFGFLYEEALPLPHQAFSYFSNDKNVVQAVYLTRCKLFGGSSQQMAGLTGYHYGKEVLDNELPEYNNLSNVLDSIGVYRQITNDLGDVLEINETGESVGKNKADINRDMRDEVFTYFNTIMNAGDLSRENKKLIKNYSDREFRNVDSENIEITKNLTMLHNKIVILARKPYEYVRSFMNNLRPNCEDDLDLLGDGKSDSISFLLRYSLDSGMNNRITKSHKKLLEKTIEDIISESKISSELDEEGINLLKMYEMSSKDSFEVLASNFSQEVNFFELFKKHLSELNKEYNFYEEEYHKPRFDTLRIKDYNRLARNFKVSHDFSPKDNKGGVFNLFFKGKKSGNNQQQEGLSLVEELVKAVVEEAQEAAQKSFRNKV
jgi:hypothetical protein